VKNINVLRGKNVELLDVKPGGTYSNHRALRGQSKVSRPYRRSVRPALNVSLSLLVFVFSLLSCIPSVSLLYVIPAQLRTTD
jgi:hypothetical protein